MNPNISKFIIFSSPPFVTNSFFEKFSSSPFWEKFLFSKYRKNELPRLKPLHDLDNMNVKMWTHKSNLKYLLRRFVFDFGTFISNKETQGPCNEFLCQIFKPANDEKKCCFRCVLPSQIWILIRKEYRCAKIFPKSETLMNLPLVSKTNLRYIGREPRSRKFSLDFWVLISPFSFWSKKISSPCPFKLGSLDSYCVSHNKTTLISTNLTHFPTRYKIKVWWEEAKFHKTNKWESWELYLYFSNLKSIPR